MMSLLSNANDAAPISVGRWLRLNAVLLALVVALSLSFPVSTLSEKLNDFYFNLRSPQPPSSKVALVVIDDASLARYGRWPWHRALLAELIRDVSKQQPLAVGIDILLPEAEDELNDNQLTEAIQAAPNAVLASKISNSPTGNLWIDPLPRFAQAAKGVGHVQALIDFDGLCRSVPLYEPSADGLRPAFSLKLAELAQETHAELTVATTGSAGIERLNAGPPFTIDYHRQVVPGRDQSSFVTVSAADVLGGNNRQALNGKVALIGFGGTEIGDRLFTPVSDQLPMPGVEINANLLDMLLTGRSLDRLGLPQQALLVIIVSAISLWLVVRRPGVSGLLVLGGMLVAGYFACYLVFVQLHQSISYAPLLLAGALAAPIAQLENLLIVDREVTSRLQHLRRTMQPDYAQSTTSPSDAKVPHCVTARLHWKLAALKELQAGLSSLYSFHQTLLETMREGLAVYGGDGVLRFNNGTWKEFCAKHQVPFDRLAGIADLNGGWPDLKSLSSDAAAWTEHEVPFEDELWLLHAVRLPWTSFADANAILLIAEDVTARRQRDQARSEALSFVTHELRTPLISIQGFSELLMRYPTSPASNEAPATIFRESNRLVAMINTYLEVLRLDAGARPLRKAPTNIRLLVEHVEKVVRPLANSAHVPVVVEVETADDFISCDESLIAGALLNLVSNAIKYGTDGSTVFLRVTRHEHEVEFEVRNAGPAIPADELEHIFERFYRPARSESIPGWGLGLSFVRRICQQHGGRVHVSSNEMSGTSFAFVLPRGAREISEVTP